MKNFNSIAAAAAALEVKSNTLSKQLKRGNGVVEMFDLKDREVVVKRHEDKTVSISFAKEVKPKAKRETVEIPSHHVHSQKSDPRMSRMQGVEQASDSREPGIYISCVADGIEDSVWWNNTLAAKAGDCTPSRISEIRRAAKVRQLADEGSFTVELKNGTTIACVKVNQIFQIRKEQRELAQAAK
jgi:hypothetical protein